MKFPFFVLSFSLLGVEALSLSQTSLSLVQEGERLGASAARAEVYKTRFFRVLKYQKDLEELDQALAQGKIKLAEAAPRYRALLRQDPHCKGILRQMGRGNSDMEPLYWWIIYRVEMDLAGDPYQAAEVRTRLLAEFPGLGSTSAMES